MSELIQLACPHTGALHPLWFEEWTSPDVARFLSGDVLSSTIYVDVKNHTITTMSEGREPVAVPFSHIFACFEWAMHNHGNERT